MAETQEERIIFKLALMHSDWQNRMYSYHAVFSFPDAMANTGRCKAVDAITTRKMLDGCIC